MLPRPLALLLVLCGLLAALPGAAQPAEPPEAPDIRAVVTGMLRAWAREELATLPGYWSARVQDRGDFDATARDDARNYAEMEARDPAFSRWNVEGDRVGVRVRFTLKRRQPGERRVESPTLAWDLAFVREGERWKLERWKDALYAWMEEYVRRATDGPPDSRAKLLAEEPDLVIPELVTRFRAVAWLVASQAEVPVALRLNDLAQEVADRLGPAERGWNWLTRGNILDLQSRRAESSELYRRALAAFREAGERTGEAEALNSLGTLHLIDGNLPEAEALFRRVAAIAGETGGDLQAAGARHNLGLIHLSRSEFPEAVASFEAAVGPFRAAGDRARELTARGNLAKAHGSMGAFGEAQAIFRETLAAARELKDKPLEASALSNLAGTELDARRYAEAAKRYQEALAVHRQLGDPAGEATALLNLSIVRLKTGETAQALRSLDEVAARYRRAGNRPGEAKALHVAGLTYLLVGRAAEAQRSMEEARERYRALGDQREEAAVLLGIGDALLAQHEPDEATEAYTEAGRLSARTGYREAQLRTFLSLAGVPLHGTTLAGGDSLAAAAAEVIEKAGDPELKAGAHLALGGAHARAGRWPEALDAYSRAGKIGKALRLPRIVFDAQKGAGWVLLRQDQWQRAAAALRAAIQAAEQLRARTEEQSLQTSLGQGFVHGYLVLGFWVLALRRPAEALATAERVRARTLADLLEHGRASVTKAMTPAERQEDAARREELLALSVHLKNARNLPTDRQLELERKLAAANAGYEAFQRTLFLRHPQLKIQRARFEPADLVRINRTLFATDPKLCVLSYLVGYQETLLFVLTRGPAPRGPAALSVYPVPTGARDLGEDADAFWRACSRAGGDYRTLGRKLYDRLILPAAKHLTGKTHVVILPDRSLDVVPFQALVDPKGRHLVEARSISYAPSVTALIRAVELGSRRRSHTGSRTAALFALGRPDFRGELADLPQSGVEVRTLSTLFGRGAQVRVGAAATESAARAGMGKARYLHFATHGILNEAAPMYSSIALARGPADDGRLQARELLELELQAEMAVLSACETARGQQVLGEGVVGLTWAFFVAGVPTTVATQWAVADDSTRALMVELYSRLPGAKPRPAAAMAVAKAQALRHAQLRLLKDGRHGHPYYWAPFILTGDWR